MTITFSVVLSNDTLGVGSAMLTALRRRRSQNTQLIGRIRNATAGKAARGNRIRSLSISVTREHATEAAAIDFVASHEAALPNEGTLDITGFDPAVLESNDNWFDGVRTYHTYEFSAGIEEEV